MACGAAVEMAHRDGLSLRDRAGAMPIRPDLALRFFCALPLLLAASVAHAADAVVLADCAAHQRETPLRSEQGSAGIMVNLAESPESIRGMAKTLLDAALKSARSAHTPTVVFRVAPSHFLPLPKQQALCTQLASETSVRPLKYADRSFTDVEAFDSWLAAFSQGQGEDGKLLYTQCGGNCDPSFTFVINHGERDMQVATEVYCGYARDRSVNLYTLSTTLRGACPAGANSFAP
jgi:hypothetical protein